MSFYSLFPSTSGSVPLFFSQIAPCYKGVFVCVCTPSTHMSVYDGKGNLKMEEAELG